jgi:hypothetical protein
MNSAKVLRIDLEKHYIPHQEIEELEEYEEADQITIEEDLSYAQLRDIQKGHIGRSYSKLEQRDTMLIQELASEE